MRSADCCGDAIIVNDGTLRVYTGGDVPGTFFKSGGSADVRNGWKIDRDLGR